MAKWAFYYPWGLISLSCRERFHANRAPDLRNEHWRTLVCLRHRMAIGVEIESIIRMAMEQKGESTILRIIWNDKDSRLSGSFISTGWLSMQISPLWVCNRFVLIHKFVILANKRWHCLCWIQPVGQHLQFLENFEKPANTTTKRKLSKKQQRSLCAQT